MDLPGEATGDLSAVRRPEENHAILFMIYGAVLALFWRQMQRDQSAAAAEKIGR